MADIHIVREHTLGLGKARTIAIQWAEQAKADFGLACTYTDGETTDEVTFSRSGVTGTLEVDASRFEVRAQLGFLMGAFKQRIEAEIVKNLDALLTSPVEKPVVQKAT